MKQIESHMQKHVHKSSFFFGLVIAIKTIFKVNGIPRTINYTK
jgi:hypothetical protein